MISSQDINLHSQLNEGFSPWSTEQDTEGLLSLTHPDCTNKTADEGDTVVFFCEYSVGNYDTYGPINTQWRKQNGTDGPMISMFLWNDPTTVYEDKYSYNGEKRVT